MPPLQCPYCGNYLESRRALNHHIPKKELCRIAQDAAVAAIRKQAQENLNDAIDIESKINDGSSDEMQGENQTKLAEGEDDNMLGGEDDIMDIFEDAPAPQPDRGPSPPPKATVEDYSASDKEQEVDFIEVETFKKEKRAGRSFGEVPTKFEQWKDELEKALGEDGKPPYSLSLKEENWGLANWLMTSGLGGKARNKYCNLPQGPWKNNRDFLKAIDTLPTGAPWSVQEVTLDGDLGTEVYELWMRNPVDCVAELLGNAAFRDSMKYAPEHHWKGGKAKNNRQYNECWTGEWWWNIQQLLPEGATVVPLILASDATQLSIFSGDKKAWPVYLMIGNIAKGVRRQPSKYAQILVGYLPAPNGECISNENQRRTETQTFFHKCMKKVVEPLIEAGTNGVYATCADGQLRHVYPILAAYVADFPEQCLVACCRRSGCPICIVPFKQRGDLQDPKPRVRKKQETSEAIREAVNRNWTQKLDSLLLRPNEDPFWEKLPHANMFCCFTPDMLHQLHKGVFKDHMVKWCKLLLGEAELDRRYKAMPEHHGLRRFQNGILGVSQWTGRELKQMERVFIGAITGLPEGTQAVHAARQLLDFINRAAYRSLSDEELRLMEEDLRILHGLKDIFVEMGALDSASGFNGIPKWHMMSHYTDAIWLLGSTDGYTTETTERLHIDFAKIGYRASNKINATGQMVIYLQRQEAIAMHSSFLNWKSNFVLKFAPAADEGKSDSEDESEDEDAARDENDQFETVIARKEETYTGHPVPTLKIAKAPAIAKCRCPTIATKHQAPQFVAAVNEFLIHKVGRKEERYQISDMDFCDVWTRLNLVHQQAPFHCPEDERLKEAIRATPAQGRKSGMFDTILLLNNNEMSGLHCYKTVRVKVIFTLPPHCQMIYHGKLAYVEHFTTFGQGYHGVTRMKKISRDVRNDNRKVSIVPIEWIRGGCHLIPLFGLMAEQGGVSDDLLETAPGFLLNRYANPNIFAYMDYWGD